MTQDQPNRLDQIESALATLIQLHVETRADISRSVTNLTDFSIRQAQRIDQHDVNLAQNEQLAEQNALAINRHDQALAQLEAQNRQMNERMERGFEQLTDNITQLTMLQADSVRSAVAQRQAFLNDITAILERFLRQSGNGSANS
jgi:hypothetical protein